MASGPPLKLTIDRQNRTLVAFNGTPISLPAIFQDNTISLQVQIVDPGANNGPAVTPGSTYTVVDMGAFGMRAAIGDTPAGTAGETPLALNTGLIWDATNKWYTGDLALNTTEVDDFLGSATEKTAYFEINLTNAGTRITILQVTFTLKAVVDELAGTAPLPSPTFISADEIRAQFVPRKMENGGVIVIPSPSGFYAVELGCNDDGTIKANIITQT